MPERRGHSRAGPERYSETEYAGSESCRYTSVTILHQGGRRARWDRHLHRHSGCGGLRSPLNGSETDRVAHRAMPDAGASGAVGAEQWEEVWWTWLALSPD